MNVIIKVTQGSITRRLPFQEPSTLESLRGQLSAHFNLPGEAHITYKDEDGDDITFSTDNELVEQLTVASATPNKVLRVVIKTPDTPTPPVPQFDTLIANISDLVTVIRGKPAPPAKRACIRAWGERERAVPERQGLFNGIRPLFSAFPQKKGLRASVKAIDNETRTEFKAAVSAIKKSKERKALMAGLNTATPAFREFVADLPDEGLPTVERVQVFVTAVEGCVRGNDDAVVSKITEFIMKGSADPALIESLRIVKDVPLMPWESGFVRSMATPRGFDVHQVTCAGCKKSPIVGTRYECTTEKYDVCADCYTNNAITQGRNFVVRQYVWEKNFEGMKVPPPPLRLGEKGNKVKFLHKVLTDLGFMNTSMYARRPGLFSENTQKAIASFQAETNIVGEAGVYNEGTANRLKQAVDEAEMTEADGNDTMEVSTGTAMKA